MILGINYANDNFRKAQRLNTKTACKNGVDKVIEYRPTDIDESFKEKNSSIWCAKRGAGYWIWKPYIIAKSFDEISEGDYLIYADSGCAYINNVKFLIDAMECAQKDVMVFQIKSIEGKYSKRDAFVLLECDSREYVESRQICATFMVIKKTKFAKEFIDEWLEKVQDSRIVSDSENVMGLPNYEGFIDNRHDQTVLSLLAKKWGIIPFRDPSQWGNDYNYANDIIVRSSYPQIFDSHRCGDISSSYFLYKNKWVKSYITSIKHVYSKIKNKLYDRRKR